MTSFRDDKKNIVACNYKKTGDSMLYTGPPCLQPSGDRSAFDLDFINRYNPQQSQSQRQQREGYKEFPASCTACNSCVDDPSDLYVKQNNIPNHPMMRFLKK